MTMSLAVLVLLLLAWQGLVSSLDGSSTALHLELRMEKYCAGDRGKYGFAKEDLPHGSRPPM